MLKEKRSDERSSRSDASSIEDVVAKVVAIMGKDINVLIDTRSDLTLMCKDEYERIGSPPLQPTKARFEGWTSIALGKFQMRVIIDGLHFPISIHVHTNKGSRHRFLIGSNFLESRNFRGKGGTIHFDSNETEDSVEILQINVLDKGDATEVDLSHIEVKNIGTSCGADPRLHA